MTLYVYFRQNLSLNFDLIFGQAYFYLLEPAVNIVLCCLCYKQTLMEAKGQIIL